jgi:hypothetical protein
MTVLLNEPSQRIDVPNIVHSREGTFTECHFSTFPEPPPRATRTYDDEREAFLALRMMLLSRYPEEYVAIANGKVYGHDRSRLRLAQRFFGEQTRGPVHIGFVGHRQVIRIPTPLSRTR